MKRFLPAFLASAIVLLGSWGLTYAAPSLFQVFQGGTGTSTPSGILYGNGDGSSPLKTLIIGSNLTLSGGTLSASGGGGSPGGASSTIQYNANSSFAGNTGFEYTGTNVGIASTSPTSPLTIGLAGTVGIPSIEIGTTGEQGIYQAGTNALGLSAGGSGLTWSGSAFTPNTTNTRNLGTSANSWANITSQTATTSSDVNFNTSGYPQDFFGPYDTSPVGNVELNSQGQGNYAFYGIKINNGGSTYDAQLGLDITDTIGGIANYLMLKNLTGSATCLGIQDNGATCLSDYNGLSSLLDTISPAYSTSGTESGMTTTLQQAAGNDAVDYGLQNYPGSAPTGIDAYQNYYTSTYAQPLPEPHFSFWEQANGNTSEAATSWGFLGATTTISGTYATTTSIDIGDLGPTAQFDGFLSPSNATFNVISSSTHTNAFTISKLNNGVLTNDLSVSNAGLASTTNLILSALGNPAGSFLAVNGIGQVIATTAPSGGGSGTVTSITLGGGIDGLSPITTTGTITAQVGTSTVPTIGGLSYWTGNATPSTLGTTATTTLTGAGVISISNAPSVIGGTPAVASLTGGTGGQYLVWLNGVPTWQATTTVSNGTGINCAFNSGANAMSCSFANQSANTVLVNQSGSNGVPTGLATTTFGNTLYGVGTTGQFLQWNGSSPNWATTLGIANGGTNATSFTTSGNAVYYDGTRLVTAPTTAAVTTPFASSTAHTVATLWDSGLTSGNCVQASTNGLLTTTGSACGSGGTNYWTSSGGNIYNNTGAQVQAPSFAATSTIATSTSAGDVWIGSTGVLPNPDLRIGTSSTPFYGRILGDVIDSEYDYNGATSINVANANVGSCAASTYFADGNNPTLGGYFGTLSWLNDGFTNGGGAGCGIGVSNLDKAEAVALANPTGEMDFDIASTTNTGFADYNYHVNNILREKLTNGGNLGLSTSSPSAELTVFNNGQIASASTTPLFFAGIGGSTTPSFYIGSANQNGYIGVGTTTPTQKLTILADSAGAFLINTFAGNIANVMTIINNVGNVVYQVSDSAAIGGLSIGTSTPFSTIAVVGDGTDPYFAFASSTSSGSTQPVAELNSVGHYITSGPKPSVSGGTSSISGNDNNGTITIVGTALTSVTLTFANTWGTAPDCTESDNQTASTGDISSVSATSITFSFSVGISTGTLWYHCVNHQ